MPETATPRHALPNLFVGQAQKELTHNDALARIDALLHPVIEAELAIPPASLSSADDGRCWLVANQPAGSWTGKEKQIARWSAGSWRYLLPCDGMMIWDKSTVRRRFYISDIWTVEAPINDPAGGSVIDAEARAALVAILQHLRATHAI